MNRMLTCAATGAVIFACVSIYSQEASAANVPVPIDSSYKLIFDDEFNGTTVDTTKWNILTSTTMGGGYSQVQFGPSNATIVNGFLKLTTTKTSSQSRPYKAGFVFTQQAWSYGYWEARAKMPGYGHGMWPAFWMNNAGNYPEIDVLEWLGDLPNTQWMTYHPNNDATLTGGAGLGTTQNGVNYSSGFHVYGMLWNPTSITWYIDGTQVFQLNQGQTWNGVTVDITSTAMSTNLNSAVGGWDNNAVDQSTSFPTYYDVDYLHIYSNSPTAVAVTPQAGYGGPGDSTGSGSF